MIPLSGTSDVYCTLRTRRLRSGPPPAKSLAAVATIFATVLFAIAPFALAQVSLDSPTLAQTSGAQSPSLDSGVSGSGRSHCVNAGDINADAEVPAGLQPCSVENSDGDGSDASNSVSGGTNNLALSEGVSQGAGMGAAVSKPVVGGALQKLGMSSDELGTLRTDVASGTLGGDDLQQFCLHLAQKQLGPGEVPAVVAALGLNLTDQQVNQLKSCAQLAAPDEQSNRNQGSTTATGSQVSSIERGFRGLDGAAVPESPSAQNLSQFGYSMFESLRSSAPPQDVPLGSNYLLGPGDELKVILWGRMNRTVLLQIGRDGSVALPEMGPVQIAGLTFEQAKKLVESQIGQITGVNVDVTMGRLRTIEVFVVGEVAQPGAHQVSALSHVANALAAAGGITKIGTLRRVELRHGNQFAKLIDLYGLLLNGHIDGDDQLESGDVIFVPVIGPVAGVAGDVKRPAIYELSSQSEPLSDLIRLAGGISAFGYAQRVQVERVESHEKRVALDLDFSALSAKRFEVHDGDLVKVYPVLPQQHDVVVATGNLNRPGKYQWREGMRVSDLVGAAEGVAPHTFFRYAMISRKEGPAKAIRIQPVDLEKALSAQTSGTDNPTLEREDSLTVFSESQMKYLPTVQVVGEVRNPGYYVLSQGMRVSDLLYLAGGLRDDAYQKQAELARTQVVNGSRTSHTFRDLDLRDVLAGGADNNPSLEANDQLFVRRATDWHLPWVVYVRGRVARPGPYTIHDGERIASVLERAGGLLPDAYLPATVLIRQSVKQIEQQRLNEARSRLQGAIVQARLNPSVLAAASGQPMNGGQPGNNDSATLSMLQQVLADSESQQAQGRLVIHLRPLDELASTPDNVAMVDQDVLTIPGRPAGVNVLGQVFNPNAIVYRPGLTVRECLAQAGGPTQSGDSDHIMMIKADGSVVTDEGIRATKQASMFPLLPAISGGLMAQRVEPGDTVYVPEKLVYVNNLQVASTVTQIVANAATSLAVLGILATNL